MIIYVFESLSFPPGGSAEFIVKWPGGNGFMEFQGGAVNIAVLWTAVDGAIRNVNTEDGGSVKALPSPTALPFPDGGNFWLPPCTIKLSFSPADENGGGCGPLRLYKK